MDQFLNHVYNVDFGETHSKKCWVKYNPALGEIWTNPAIEVVLTQRLGYYPEGLVKHLTQPLGQNNPIAGFVHISPSAGLYLTQHFLECNFQTSFIFFK